MSLIVVLVGVNLGVAACDGDVSPQPTATRNRDGRPIENLQDFLVERGFTEEMINETELNQAYWLHPFGRSERRTDKTKCIFRLIHAESPDAEDTKTLRFIHAESTVAIIPQRELGGLVNDYEPEPRVTLSVKDVNYTFFEERYNQETCAPLKKK
jgi:hypothetical protein